MWFFLYFWHDNFCSLFRLCNTQAMTEPTGTCSASAALTCPKIKIEGEDIQLVPKRSPSNHPLGRHHIISNHGNMICSLPGKELTIDTRKFIMNFTAHLKLLLRKYTRSYPTTSLFVSYPEKMLNTLMFGDWFDLGHVTNCRTVPNGNDT